MKFILTALVAATSAVRVQQLYAGTATGTTTATATGGTATTTGIGGVCPGTTPTTGPPATQQCNTGDAFVYSVIDATGQCGWTCIAYSTGASYAPVNATTSATATATGTGTTGGNTVGQLCTTQTPTTGPTTTQQCNSGDVSVYSVVGNTGGQTQCDWTCQPGGTGNQSYQAPTEDEQINQFASGFFQQCDSNQNDYMTQKELKKCLRNLINEQQDMMENSLDQQRTQMQEQINAQKQQYKTMGKYIYDGVSTYSGFQASKGMSKSLVVLWLQHGQHWNHVQNLMNGPPPQDTCEGAECGTTTGTCEGTGCTGHTTATGTCEGTGCTGTYATDGTTATTTGGTYATDGTTATTTGGTYATDGTTACPTGSTTC